MHLDHQQYTKLVMGAYYKKRANNELSLLLAQSTPSKIRQACLHLYKEYCDKKEPQILRKDEQTLRDFFGPAEHGRQFIQLIQDFETDKFRPLDNYLKGNTEKTDERNLELFAWLINFQHRPWVMGNDFQLSDEEIALIKNDIVSPPIPKPPEGRGGEGGRKPEVPIKSEPDNLLDKIIHSMNNWLGEKSKKIIVFFLILVCAGVGYVMWQAKQDKQISFGNTNTGCMYWANDHYEKIPCNEEEKGRLIIPLNEEKMNNFKKITKPDTITERSIGMIYYLKNEGKIEYFTMSGNHPVHINRSLKVLSAYMFGEHLAPKQAIAKDSLAGQKTKFINNK
jgi:hypothetical protein